MGYTCSLDRRNKKHKRTLMVNPPGKWPLGKPRWKLEDYWNGS